MKLKIVAIAVLSMCMCTLSAQNDTRPPAVIKTSLTSPLSPLPYGVIGIEIPIGPIWSIESRGGITFGGYSEGRALPGPLTSVLVYKKLKHIEGAKQPARIGLDISYRKVNILDSHRPCMEYEYVGSSGWFGFPHECVNRPTDYFFHHQEHFKVLFLVGKRFHDKQFVWELDFGVGMEHVTSYDRDKLTRVPHPDYDDSHNPFDITFNPFVRDAGTEWLPTFKVDLKFGAKLQRP